MPSQAMRIRAFDYDVKGVDDAGKFAGYASVFGVVDSYNEVVAPGAFIESLNGLRAKGRALPTLWQHRSGEPIGHWNMDTLTEDGHGLAGEGELWLAESSYARIAHRGMQSRAITGLSIGYYVRDSSKDQKTGQVTLKKLDLVEISIVTNPANDDARIDVIKSKLAHGGKLTLREFEEFLRDAGYSKHAAEFIATRGAKAWLARGDTGSEALAGGDIAAALSGFQLRT
jgi:HK97 family phage prohead protease